MQTKDLCKEGRLEKCMGCDKSFSQQIIECQSCSKFNEKYRVVNRLEYALFEASRGEEQEVKNKKGRTWARYKYMAGLLAYIKEFDEGFYKDMEAQYKEIVNLQREMKEIE